MELSRAGIDDNEAISFKEVDINVGFSDDKLNAGRTSGQKMDPDMDIYRVRPAPQETSGKQTKLDSIDQLLDPIPG